MLEFRRYMYKLILSWESYLDDFAGANLFFLNEVSRAEHVGSEVIQAGHGATA